MVRATREVQRLWREYKRSHSLTLRDQLVEQYLPLVDYLAERMAERLPRCVDVDDLRSAGAFGLLEAVEGFDPDRNIKFETYCSLRIRGAMLDELRARDWVPRLVRSRTQKFTRAVRQLRADLGHPPTPCEVMEQLGLTSREYDETQNDLHRLAIYSLSAQGEDDETDNAAARNAAILTDRRESDPTSAACWAEETAAVLSAVTIDKGREILTLYYLHGLTMKEIGRMLRLSESRVCQIHGRVIEWLRQELPAASFAVE